MSNPLFSLPEAIARVRQLFDELPDVGIVWAPKDAQAILQVCDAANRLASLSETPLMKVTLAELQRRYGLNAANAMKLQADLSAVASLEGPAPYSSGCVNCGEDNDGGYVTGFEGHIDEGNVGPFCSMCWEFLREHFQKELSGAVAGTSLEQIARAQGVQSPTDLEALGTPPLDLVDEAMEGTPQPPPSAKGEA